DSVTQDAAKCVVYKICVANTGQQDLTGVTVTDTGGPGGSLTFNTVAAGATSCQLIPTTAAVGNCTGGTCVCTAVSGTDTAAITTATCALQCDSACTKAGSNCSDTASVGCQSCQVSIDKTVAKDDNCDGTADDPNSFADSVTQDAAKCVVYKICVANTGQQDLTGVTVTDTGGPGGSLTFNTVAAGATSCQLIPTTAAVGNCTGGTCVCTAVSGTDTAAITTATCALSSDSACTKAGSKCSDTASVACETCQAQVVKTVAKDDNCDGTADDPNSFVDSVTQDAAKCVVYKICV